MLCFVSSSFHKQPKALREDHVLKHDNREQRSNALQLLVNTRCRYLFVARDASKSAAVQYSTGCTAYTRTSHWVSLWKASSTRENSPLPSVLSEISYAPISWIFFPIAARRDTRCGTRARWQLKEVYLGEEEVPLVHEGGRATDVTAHTIR